MLERIFVNTNINKKSILNAGFAELIGAGGVNSVQVTSNNALKKSDIVYSCVNLIASTIAKMPVSLFNETDKGKVKVSNQVSYLLKSRANEFVSAIDFKQAMIANLLIYGNAFAMINTIKGVPNELILLDSLATSVEKINGKLFIITTVDNKHYKLQYNQVIHLKDLTVDGINGISRITAARMKLNNKSAADAMLNRFYEKGGALKGILSVPANLNDEAKLKLKSGFNSMLQASSDNIAVLENSFDFKATPSLGLADSDFVNNSKLTKEDIASIFGVPVPLLGSTDGTSYSNMSEMNRNFIQSIIPLIEKFEQELNYKLLTFEQRYDMYFKFNTSVALRANDLDRATYYKNMVQNGFMSINEVRRLEDLDDIKGGDSYYRSLNYVNLEYADQYQLGKVGATETEITEITENKEVVEE